MDTPKQEKLSIKGIVSILCLIGLYYIATTTNQESISTYTDPWFITKKQILWLITGSLAAISSSLFISIKTLKRTALLFYISGITMLILVLIPGIGIQTLGAQRWINLFGLSLQPIEYFKICTLIYFSSLFSNPKPVGIIHVAIALLPPLTLILLQPNMSGFILILAIVIFMYIYSGKISIKKIIPPIAILAIFAILLVITSPYRMTRLKSLIEPENASYHSQQLQKTIGSAGLFGSGIGNSQQKLQFVPQLAKDSMISVITEENGIVGLGIICYLYFLLYTKIINQYKDDKYAQLFSYGLATWIITQATINISSNVGLIPLTGVPLPFMSYGGSALVSQLICVGIIAKKHNV